LKQAAGKVRCGGCGHAFNALEYLSESMQAEAPVQDAAKAVPELSPDPTANDDGLPAPISAEQSAALLKTLDELAGSDIRIEDTGVEWRVLDDEELGEAAGDDVAIVGPAEDQLELDEILEESPTPVDQFLTETPPQIDAPEIFEKEVNEPARTPVEELRFDDNTPLPDDFDLDGAPSYEPTVEAEPESVEPEPEAEESAQADLELSEPDEWTDILDEFEGLVEGVSEPTIADELEVLDTIDDEDVEEELTPDEPEDSDNRPLDMDSQFALQAEAMGIDLSGMHETLEADEDVEEVPKVEEEDLDALLNDNRVGDRDIEELLEEELVDDRTVGDLGFEELEEDEAEDDDRTEEETDEDLEVEDEGAGDDDSIPPMSEEEQTINMQIDQDLLAIAIEDKDGFASTMVLPEDAAEDKAAEKKGKKEKKLDAAAEQALKDTSAGFETIIMEGEAFRSADDVGKLEEDTAAAASLAGAAAAEREAEKAARAGERNYGMIAGVVVLVLVLAGQYLHQSRDSLATIPAFNNVVGPMYRALGQPLSPDWDITGWRFETTRHSVSTVEETEGVDGREDVVIFSRIGNNSDKPLPYPVIGVALTDRFEEPVGSVVLDPANYLANDLDPRKLVIPGNSFEAVMTIRSPSEDATSFRLRVCYRNSDGSLRCKDSSFK